MRLSVSDGSLVLGGGGGGGWRKRQTPKRIFLQAASYFPGFKFIHLLIPQTLTWCQALVRCRVDDRDESDRLLP